jgi:hypothetical protein
MRAGIHHDKRLIFVDNTALQEFRTCPAKFQWRINRGLYEARLEMSGNEPPPVSAPLLFGGAMHTALDELYGAQSPKGAGQAFLDAFQPPPDDPKRTAIRGIEMLTEYWDTWGHVIDGYSGIVCETSFRAPMGQVIHPATGEPWDVVYSGLIDKIVTDPEGNTFCIDHKTSTMQTAALSRSYNMSNQFQGYMYGARHAPGLGFEIDHLVVDLLLLFPRNNKFERHTLSYDEERQADWKKDIFSTVRQILLADHDQQWARYGQQSCVTFHQLCQFYRLCNSPAWNVESEIESFYGENFWEAERT